MNVLVAGCDAPAPPLLARQSVVLGVSDGVIRKPDFAAVAVKTRKLATASAAAAAAAAAPAAGPDTAAILQVCNNTAEHHFA